MGKKAAGAAVGTVAVLGGILAVRAEICKRRGRKLNQKEPTGEENAGLKIVGSGNAGLKIAGSGNVGLKNASSGNAGLKNAGSGKAGLKIADSGNAGLKIAGSGNAGLKNAGSGNVGLKIADSGSLKIAGSRNAGAKNTSLKNANAAMEETTEENIGFCSTNTVGLEKKEHFYAERLARMIACETVSVKDVYDDTEFEKLRTVIRNLFPLVTTRAELKIFGDDCYVYRIPGRDTARNVMVMSHHDVAPVSGNWTHPAFSGEVADGCIWGRGTVDTKTPLFAEFSAIEELLQEGFIPACNLYLASSHNEEIGGDGIPLAVSFFMENGIQFEWILDEGGAVIDAPMGGINCKCAMLAIHEKGRHTLEFTAEAGSGHAGLSAGADKPAVRMAEFMTRVKKKPPFIRKISPEMRAMFDGLAPYMAFPMRLIFANMWLFSGLLKKIIPALNEQAGAMLGTGGTFNKINTAEDGSCRAEMLLRFINPEDLESDIESVIKIAEGYGITVRDAAEGNEFHKPASLRSPGYRYIKECVERNFAYAACAPFILPAGTDARHFCEMCDSVIRFAPIDINNQQFKSVHGVDENIGTKAVVRAVKFYKDLVRGMR